MLYALGGGIMNGKIFDSRTGAYTNYVAIFFEIFDPPSPHVDKCVHFEDPPYRLRGLS